MTNTILTLLSIIGISTIAFVGIVILAFGTKKIDTLLPYLVSFATGALLGDAFIHLLPTAFEQTNNNLTVSLSALSAIVLFFTLERILYWHRCYHIGKCDHRSTLGIVHLVGDSIHNALDGIIIAGSYLVSIPLGITTTIAVMFHEIPQEIADFGVLLHAGFAPKQALLLNLVSACFAILGAVAVLFVSPALVHLKTFLVPFTAGSFIYIASSTLIPELHKEPSIRHLLTQLLALCSGIAVMASLLWLE